MTNDDRPKYLKIKKIFILHTLRAVHINLLANVIIGNNGNNIKLFVVDLWKRICNSIFGIQLIFIITFSLSILNRYMYCFFCDKFQWIRKNGTTQREICRNRKIVFLKVSAIKLFLVFIYRYLHVCLFA